MQVGKVPNGLILGEGDASVSESKDLLFADAPIAFSLIGANDRLET
jgi:hypothetical protein